MPFSQTDRRNAKAEVSAMVGFVNRSLRPFAYKLVTECCRWVTKPGMVVAYIMVETPSDRFPARTSALRACEFSAWRELRAGLAEAGLSLRLDSRHVLRVPSAWSETELMFKAAAAGGLVFEEEARR